MLTADNLFDGTISTNTEHFYIEPANKYSESLPRSGVHSIIYKLSDVKMDINNHNDIDNKHEPHCASEKLFRRLQKENNLFKEFNSESSLTNEHNVNEKSDINLKKLKRNDGLSRQSDNRKDKLDVVKRFKRWLPAEEVRLSQHQILYKMMSSSTFLCSINFNEELFCGGTAFWSSRLQIKRCFIQDYRSSLS